MPPIHVVLIEPNVPLRSAILAILTAADFDVETCESLEQAIARSAGAHGTVALVAWQAMDGLLSDEHRHDLAQINARVRLVVMVPRRWSKLLENTDLGTVVTAIVAKPFEADELLTTLQVAARQPAMADLSASS